MKTTCRLLLLAVLAAGSGCWTVPSLLTPEAPPPPPVVEPPKPHGPVLPERVTPDNAHQAADALSDELDRAERNSREW
jgi:hypothetical protein